MSDCIFCSILTGNMAGTFVYRDEMVAVFMDIQPINMGHLLVVPILHTPGLAELSPETGAHMFSVAQKMAQALRNSGLPCQGINLLLSDGRVAGQDVLHVHLHVVPRMKGDGFSFKFSHGHQSYPSRAEFEHVAETIVANITE